VRHLLDRYGSLIDEVLQLAADRPELLEPITEAPVYPGSRPPMPPRPRARCTWRTSCPGGCGSRSSTRTAGRLCAREVAETVAPILNWSPADVDREVATYLARVEAEVLSQTQPDDESADALRAAAPEARAEILEPVPLV
jgi:glycerol-3-phosphate dehydrogenase